MSRCASPVLAPIVAVLLTAATLLITATPAWADGSAYRSIGAAQHPDWMGALPDSRPISELSVPGTHDSMSILGGSLTQTQEDFGASGATLARQLDAGIRMIDIRVRVLDGGKFAIHHGAVYQNANFDDVLGVLDGFLRAHSRETVLMRLKQECTGGFGSCTDVGGQPGVADILDRYVAARPDLFWSPSVQRGSGADNPQLGQVRGRVVLAVLHGAGGSPIDRYGLAQFADWRDGSSTYVQDEYHVPNWGAIATKRDQVRRFLDATNGGDRSRIHVNFSSGSSLGAHPDDVAGGAGGVQGVNPALRIEPGRRGAGVDTPRSCR